MRSLHTGVYHEQADYDWYHTLSKDYFCTLLVNYAQINC